MKVRTTTVIFVHSFLCAAVSIASAPAAALWSLSSSSEQSKTRSFSLSFPSCMYLSCTCQGTSKDCLLAAPQHLRWFITSYNMLCTSLFIAIQQPKYLLFHCNTEIVFFLLHIWDTSLSQLVWLFKLSFRMFWRCCEGILTSLHETRLHIHSVAACLICSCSSNM